MREREKAIPALFAVRNPKRGPFKGYLSRIAVIFIVLISRLICRATWLWRPGVHTLESFTSQASASLPSGRMLGQAIVGAFSMLAARPPANSACLRVRALFATARHPKLKYSWHLLLVCCLVMKCFPGTNVVVLQDSFEFA